jgi:hypothetical protein
MRLPSISLSPVLAKIINSAVVVIGIVLFSLLMLEAIFYGGIVKAYFGIDLWPVAGLFLSGVLLTRFVNFSSTIRRVISWLFLYCLPVFAVTAVFLDFADDVFYINFSFSTFHLHPLQFHFVVLFLSSFFLLAADWGVIRSKIKHLIFGFPFATISAVAIAKHLYYSSWFHFLRREDGVFEYITAIGYLAAGILMVLVARRLWQKKSYRLWKLVAPFCLVVGIVLGGVAGEEISWGQRIFGIETPEFIADRNTQGEITLHNHESILPYVYYAYFALALYGIVSALIKLGLTKLFWLKDNSLKFVDFIAPDWYLIPLFLPTLYYTTYRFTLGWAYHGIGQWEEITEAYLGVAAFIFALALLNKVKRLELKKSK